MEFCFDYNYCENNCFDSSNTSVRHSSDFRESGTDCDVETYEEVDTTSDNNVCVYDDLIEFEQSDSDNDIMEQGDGLELKAGMIFETWAKAESYLDDYAKQQGFCLCKKRRIPDPHDNNITRRRTFECSHANVHESEKVVLAENRRDRDSEMIGCTWHTNLAFPKKEKGVRINSVIGKHNHSMNPLVGEIAPKFRKLTEEMLEKIKFWTIYDELLQDFLTPQILQKQRDQISQSLCYDVTLVTDWLPLLEVRDDFFQERLGREDEYDQPQSLFASLLENVPQSSIMEVWKVIRHRGQQLSSQYVILLDDGSHLCTCLWLINRGIVCRHFFRVMSYSAHARFHITLIPRRWHNDKKFNLNQDHASIPSYQIGKDESDISEQTPLQSISFSHLERIRKMPDIMQMQGPKQKYGFGMGYAKKALDYAVRADKVEEFVTQLKVFIEETKEDLSDQQDSVENMVIGDPLRTQHKGRQPNRYKSGGE
ncbi:hypothetical protein RhiirA5_379865, partial [Rhizophagus irregularis]